MFSGNILLCVSRTFFLLFPWNWKMYWGSFFNTSALVWQQPFYTILDVKHLGRSWVYSALTMTETCCLHLAARQARRPIFMRTSSIYCLYMRDYERYNCLNEPPAADMMSLRPSEARVNLTFLPASFSPTSTCPVPSAPCAASPLMTSLSFTGAAHGGPRWNPQHVSVAAATHSK